MPWRIGAPSCALDEKERLAGREESQAVPGKRSGEHVERRRSLPTNCSSSPRRRGRSSTGAQTAPWRAESRGKEHWGSKQVASKLLHSADYLQLCE